MKNVMYAMLFTASLGSIAPVFAADMQGMKMGQADAGEMVSHGTGVIKSLDPLGAAASSMLCCGDVLMYINGSKLSGLSLEHANTFFSAVPFPFPFPSPVPLPFFFGSIVNF